jgi:hypothetical protein
MKHLADVAQPTARHERSTGDLGKLLSEQASVLVRDELKLAQLEMTRKGKWRDQDRHGRDKGKGTAMTTSDSPGTPVPQPAAEAEASDGELSPQVTENAVNADGPEAAPLTRRIAAPGDDPQQLEAEIERTREQLGDTVQELAGRADVKNRARARAAEARRNAAARAGSVRSQVASKTAAARHKVTSVGADRKDQLRTRAAAVGAPVWEATPEPVRRAVTKGANGARERWVPLAVAGGVLIAGCLAVRQWSRRSPGTGPG